MRMRIGLWTGLATALVAAAEACAQQSPGPGPVVIDSVVAVVNNRAILASDIADEMHVAVLEPDTQAQRSTPSGALHRLISRTLIQEQIHQEDALTAAPTQKQI